MFNIPSRGVISQPTRSPSEIDLNPFFSVIADLKLPPEFDVSKLLKYLTIQHQCGRLNFAMNKKPLTRDVKYLTVGANEKKNWHDSYV